LAAIGRSHEIKRHAIHVSKTDRGGALCEIWLARGSAVDIETLTPSLP
jgi:hypothetical protein